LITSAFSRMPGAVSMAVIPSRRNAGPARQGKASGFGRRKSKNEEKEDPRSDCTYLPGKTRRRRAASRQGGGRRRAPRLRPHEPSSNPRPSTSRRRREIFFRLSLFRDLLACRVCFACLVGLKRESGARRAGARCSASRPTVTCRVDTRRASDAPITRRGGALPRPVCGARLQRHKSSVRAPFGGERAFADVAPSWVLLSRRSEPLDDFTALPLLGFLLFSRDKSS
jgi:hypothetical protein